MGHHKKFRRAHGKTQEIPETNGNILGKADAIYLRNRYQKELDNANAAFVNMVHYLEGKTDRLKEAFNRAQGLKQNISAHESERTELYTSLNNLLKKETDFEGGMWGKTLASQRKAKAITIKQKFKDSDVENYYDSMLGYLKQYPEYATKSSFRKILDKIDQKEGEIRRERQAYNDAVSKYNYFLSDFEKDIKKAEDKDAVYQAIFAEGEKKLSETRFAKYYVKFPFVSEKTKEIVHIDILHHRMEQFRNTLRIIKGELAQSKRVFGEMSY